MFPNSVWSQQLKELQRVAVQELRWVLCVRGICLLMWRSHPPLLSVFTRLHTQVAKPALGQGVEQMLWRGVPQHACGARPCLQTDLVALPETEELYMILGDLGTGNLCIRLY